MYPRVRLKRISIFSLNICSKIDKKNKTIGWTEARSPTELIYDIELLGFLSSAQPTALES